MESIPRPVSHLEENTLYVRSLEFCLPETAAQSTFERVGDEDNHLRFPSIIGALALWKLNGSNWGVGANYLPVAGL